ncbi:MAG: hypothetical protein BWZ10_02658 [candidate division BRC1 bacterium ADurb.BinA364]|nr:MAG: hypothetical protein BWZ10_02658 [candidate division BRC1 bacterium ADurb.BinA364]
MIDRVQPPAIDLPRRIGILVGIEHVARSDVGVGDQARDGVHRVIVEPEIFLARSGPVAGIQVWLGHHPEAPRADGFEAEFVDHRLHGGANELVIEIVILGRIGVAVGVHLRRVAHRGRHVVQHDPRRVAPFQDAAQVEEHIGKIANRIAVGIGSLEPFVLAVVAPAEKADAIDITHEGLGSPNRRALLGAREHVLAGEIADGPEVVGDAAGLGQIDIDRPVARLGFGQAHRQRRDRGRLDRPPPCVASRAALADEKSLRPGFDQPPRADADQISVDAQQKWDILAFGLPGEFDAVRRVRRPARRAAKGNRGMEVLAAFIDGNQAAIAKEQRDMDMRLFADMKERLVAFGRPDGRRAEVDADGSGLRRKQLAHRNLDSSIRKTQRAVRRAGGYGRMNPRARRFEARKRSRVDFERPGARIEGGCEPKRNEQRNPLTHWRTLPSVGFCSLAAKNDLPWMLSRTI